MLAQVANRLGTDTAGPDIPIGSDLGRGDTGQARNDLAFLNQRAFDNIIVTIPESLRDARDTIELGLAYTLLQTFDHGLVLLNWRRYAHTHRIQLDALLGNLADERIRLHFIAYEIINMLKLICIEV